jgi:hypothetical protein
MKQLIPIFLFLLPCLAWAQYPSNGNQKITLGEQTSADGLIFRGVALTDTVRKPSIDTMAYMVLDTTTNIIWHYKKQTSNAWLRLNLLPSDTAAIAYVNTYGTQTVNGAKTFSSTVTGARFDPTSSSVSGTGMYLESANNLTFSAGGVKKLKLSNTGNNVLTGSVEAGGFFINNTGGSARLQVNGNNSEAIAYFYNNSNSTGNVPGVAIEAGTNSSDYSLISASSVGTSYLRVRGDGKVIVSGTTDNGSYNLQVNGTGVWGAGAYVNGSDFNIKENIENLDSSLSLINNLKPVTYKYNESFNSDEQYQIGFIAQDIYQNFENKKYVNGIVRSDGEILSMNYSALIPILTKAIQEQQALIKALEQRIINLENK